jgi:hypothetical protein
MKDKSPSEGEQFIIDFLKWNRIKFKREVKINSLKGDTKSFRDRIRYKEKSMVYRQNRIPCIFIYPENLGIITYVFDKRMIDVLKQFDLKWQFSSLDSKGFYMTVEMSSLSAFSPFCFGGVF